GSQEGDAPDEWAANLRDARAMVEHLVRLGYRRGENLAYFEGHGDAHDERTWGHRAGMALRFLYGPARHQEESPMPS
ncbi:MAG: hypothetical protein ACLGIN_08935, partial [Candidatus Sericytochromatia bacterium]